MVFFQSYLCGICVVFKSLLPAPDGVPADPPHRAGLQPTPLPAANSLLELVAVSTEEAELLGCLHSVTFPGPLLTRGKAFLPRRRSMPTLLAATLRGLRTRFNLHWRKQLCPQAPWVPGDSSGFH